MSTMSRLRTLVGGQRKSLTCHDVARTEDPAQDLGDSWHTPGGGERVADDHGSRAERKIPRYDGHADREHASPREPESPCTSHTEGPRKA